MAAHAPYAAAADIKRDFGARGDGSTDDTTAFTNAGSQLSDGEQLFIPRGLYKLTAPWEITKAISVLGAGVADVIPPSATHTLGDYPVTSPYLYGAVLLQTAAGANGVSITKAGASVSLRDFGVRFADSIRHTNTGHGVDATASTTYQSHADSGVFDATWSNVRVFGHDGNHYAFHLMNPSLVTLSHLRGFGGGGLQIEGDSSYYNYGNVVCLHPSFAVYVGGTAHAYSLRSYSGAHLNIVTMIRPQGIMDHGAASVFPEIAGDPTISQYLFRANEPADISRLVVIGADLESATIQHPVRFGSAASNFIDPSGIFGNSADTTSKQFPIFYSPYSGKRLDSNLQLAGTASVLPTLTAGAGAGTGATVQLYRGDDYGGIIIVTAAGTPTTFSKIVTLTYGQMTLAPKAVSFQPRNANAAALANQYVRESGTAIDLYASSTALTAGQQYEWYFQVQPQ